MQLVDPQLFSLQRQDDTQGRKTEGILLLVLVGNVLEAQLGRNCIARLQLGEGEGGLSECAVSARHDSRAHREPVPVDWLDSHHSHPLTAASAKHWDGTMCSRSSTAAKGRNTRCLFSSPSLPLGGARSALPGCSPHQTSSPGSGAHSSHGCAGACQQGACGRTYTVPLVCTAQGREEEEELSGHATNGAHSWISAH